MRKKIEPLTASQQSALRRAIAEHGLLGAAARIGISAGTIARAAAGMGVYGGTRVAVVASLNGAR